MELIDTHIHLDFEDYDADRDEVIERAKSAGISRMISIGAGGGIESSRRAIALAEKYSCIWASVGVHPHDAGKEISSEELTSLAKHPRVVAIGETGLDFFRDWSPRDKQYEWFERQIGLAIEVSKPLIIHSRSAGDECFRVLKENGALKVGGVFHCFSEDAKFAERLREINFIVSFPGSVTFKKADLLRAIAREIPLDRIMLETDGPYMAPEPFRGKRAESAHVSNIAHIIATVKGVSVEEVAARTTENALRLFFGGKK